MTSLADDYAGVAALVERQRSQQAPAPPVALAFHSLDVILDQVRAAPPMRFLARPVFPGDAYGVLGAVMKAGKTWLVLDLILAVLTGGSWLGHFPIERSGSVVAFLGEGGTRKMTRRLSAIADHYGTDLAGLPLQLCFRSPHLSNELHLALVREELARTRPVLVVLDPFYLSARGAQGSQLYEMGAVLESVQALCQEVGAALLVVHHLNRQEGRGMGRLSGAGPAEWGRVIVTAEVRSANTDPITLESNVVLELDFAGDEIPETTLRLRRRVRAVSPDDLESPLVYSVEVLEEAVSEPEKSDGLTPSARRVLTILDAAGDWLDVKVIGDRLAVDGFPLKARTIQAAAKGLVEADLIEVRTLFGTNSLRWRTLRMRNPSDPCADGLATGQSENVF